MVDHGGSLGLVPVGKEERIRRRAQLYAANAHGNEGHVGSNLDKAVWQELGTAKIPPRSFLAAAAEQQQELIHKMAVKAVRAVIRGEGLHGSEMLELLHVLKHVGHVVGEAMDKILDGPDDKENRR
jgi:hypothetical protein